MHPLLTAFMLFETKLYIIANFFFQNFFQDLFRSL